MPTATATTPAPPCSCRSLTPRVGTETYGAGRYLDLEPDDDGTWTLDFNLAYQPSCVYDPRSLVSAHALREPPVGLRVEAGERLPEGYAEAG